MQCTENEEQSKENNNVGEGITVVSEGIELILRFFSQDRGLTYTVLGGCTGPGSLLPNRCLTPGETFSLGCSTYREGKEGSG